MKIEEVFVTISLCELNRLCKKHSLRFQKGFDETDFLIFFEDQKYTLLNQKRMSELIFNVTVDNA